MYLGQIDALGGAFIGHALTFASMSIIGVMLGLARIPWIPTGIKEMKNAKSFGVVATGFDEYGQISEKIVSDGIYKGKGVDNSGFPTKKFRNILLNVFECESSTPTALTTLALKNLAKITS